MPNIFDYIREALPTTVVVVCTLLVLWLAHRLLEKRALVEQGYRFRKQVILLGLAMVGIIVVIVALPVSGELRGQC